MERKHPITTEELRKKFKSQFDLVTYAIRLAENMIQTGREARVKTEMRNRSIQILAEISEGKDKFDDIPEPAVVEVVEFATFEEAPRLEKKSRGSKETGSRKGRKILSDSKL